MASTEIIDLDDLLGEPKRVRLNDTVYTLPAQIPVPLYLTIKQRQKERAEKIEKGEDVDDLDVIQEIHKQVLDLFRVHQPNLDVIPCGIDQLFEIIPTIYPTKGGDGEGNGDDDPNPPSTRATRAPRGSRSSTPRKRASNKSRPR